MTIGSLENAFSLKGKNAIITGGNKGIGAGIATAFAKQGASIAIMARDEVTGQQITSELSEKFGGKVVFIKTDIADFQNCKASVERAIKELGNINILVNNAGVKTTGNLLDMGEDLAEWHKCINIDLNGAVRMSYLLGKHMRAVGNGGRIINISSNAGEICSKMTNMITYSSAKAALNLFTKGLAVELAKDGIRVNAIAPGFIDSEVNMPEAMKQHLADMIPVKRLGHVYEIGALAVYLGSDISDDMTGAILTMDGGHSLAI